MCSSTPASATRLVTSMTLASSGIDCVDPANNLNMKPQSLQKFCRKSILRALTLCRLDRIDSLPLPTTLKIFLATFDIPADFETDGFHMSYNFHFSHHPHHRSHRVHPAVCTFMEDIKVLIKVVDLSINECQICSVIGRQLDHQQISDQWASVKHQNFQECYLKMIDAKSKLLCYVMEYPVVSLRDIIYRLSFACVQIPEIIIWDTVYKIASVLGHLNYLNLISELHEPHNFVLDASGEIKLENMLLYLPGITNERCKTGIQQPKAPVYTAPEQWVGHRVDERSTVWGLGCLFHELASLEPAFTPLSYSIHMHMSPDLVQYPGKGVMLRPVLPPQIPSVYSKHLQDLIRACIRHNPMDRPTFQDIERTAGQLLPEYDDGYTGPQNLLQILPEMISDD